MTSEIVREPDGHPVYRRRTAKTWTGTGEGTDWMRGILLCGMRRAGNDEIGYCENRKIGYNG